MLTSGHQEEVPQWLCLPEESVRNGLVCNDGGGGGGGGGHFVFYTYREVVWLQCVHPV